MADEGDPGERMFRLLREYLVHEDDLINQRTKWLITIQSFLIATFGFSVQKLLEVIAKGDVPLSAGVRARYFCFLLILVFVGLATSYVSRASVKAAVTAMDSLGEHWRKNRDKYPGPEWLPGLIGGGSLETHFKGTRMPLWLPNVFFILWVLVAALVLSAVIDIRIHDIVLALGAGAP